MMAEALGILLISGEPDRAYYAFVLAAGAAALGRDVVLFATNEGTRALRADISTLAMTAHPAGTASLVELRGMAIEIGVRLTACELGLLNAGVAASELLGCVEVAGIATFLEAVQGGQIVTL